MRTLKTLLWITLIEILIVELLVVVFELNIEIHVWK